MNNKIILIVAFMVGLVAGIVLASWYIINNISITDVIYSNDLTVIDLTIYGQKFEYLK